MYFVKEKLSVETSLTGSSCCLVRLFVTFGGGGEIKSTARLELPYPCCSQAKTRGESSRKGKKCNGVDLQISI